MRRKGLIFIVATVAIASGPGPAKKKNEPLPPLNARVEAFARANLGRPVGDGVCVTLAIEALREAGAKRFPFDSAGDFLWGEIVPDFKDALPGDILQFRDAVFHGKRPLGNGRMLTSHQEYHHHTAIVAKVEQGGKLITVYHQNVVTKGRDKTEKGKVQEGELRMDWLQKGGWVRAYRPVASEPARKPFAEDDAPGP